MSETTTQTPGAAAASAPAANPIAEMSGLRKAAIFLAQVSTEQAGMIMAHLKESEIDDITHEIMTLRDVGASTVDGVLDEFRDMAHARQLVGQGGFDFARQALEKGLGKERADDILSRLNLAFQETPFAALRGVDVRQIHTFIKDEHPQIIALVLAHLPADTAAGALARFAPEVQGDVAHRLAVMERSSPETIRAIEEELSRRMGSVVARQDSQTVGGVHSLVNVIARSDRTAERSILERLDAENPELAERVRAQMFVFEDIVKLDDRSIQQVLREIEIIDLATALKGAKEDVLAKVVGNLSTNAAENLTEEIELLGPVRLKSVEEAQVKVVAKIRALEASGALVISRGGEDEFVA